MPSYEETIDQLIALSHFLGDPSQDFAILGEGNTSARVDEETFLVKASGKQLHAITPDGFCSVRFGRILSLLEETSLSDHEVRQALLDSRADGVDSIMPSVETFFHAYLLTLPTAQFVGHCHPAAVNAILCSINAREAVAGRLFPDEIVCCGVAPCFVEYVDPGIPLARKIRDRVMEFQKEHGEWPKVILMQNHGLIAVGRSVQDVQAATSMYVKVARILLGAYALGGPRFLSPDNVARIHTRPDESYRRRQLGQEL